MNRYMVTFYEARDLVDTQVARRTVRADSYAGALRAAGVAVPETESPDTDYAETRDFAGRYVSSVAAEKYEL
jgi:hypothetical protein